MKKIVIPFGKGEIELTAEMIQDVHYDHYKIAPKTLNTKIVDAILSYFRLNCLSYPGKK